MSMKLCFLFVLCLTIVPSDSNQDIPVQPENIEKYVIINERDDNYIKDVTIHESLQKCSILYYTYSNCNMGIVPVPKMYASYTGVGCKFSEWTMKKIYDFVKYFQFLTENINQMQDLVERLPLIENINNNIIDFTQSLKDLIHFVNSYVEEFITILDKYLDIYQDRSFYTDTTILKTFTSLKRKIHYISSNYDENNQELRISDTIIIKIILEEMNALQKFLSIYCLDLPFDENNSPFYGYWITPDDPDKDTVDLFLNSFEHSIFKFKKINDCNEKQLLLENFVTVTSSDPISLLIKKSLIKIPDSNTISIGDILNEINEFSDIEVMYWYFDSVLRTIIKLIFHKIIQFIYAGNNRLPDETIKIIKNISKKIDENKQKLPRYLVDSFIFLQNENNMQIVELVKHDKLMLTNITITGDNRTTTGFSEINCLHKIVQKVDNHLDDIICSNRYLKYLGYEYGKYFIPFLENKSALLSINSYNNIASNTLNDKCNFVISIYSMCFKILDRTNKKNINNKEIKFLHQALLKIEYYFLVIIYHGQKKNMDDFDLLRMVFNIAIMLINIPCQAYKNVFAYHLNRVLNVIMTDLNYYGIKVCTSPDINFILYNHKTNISIENDNLYPNKIVPFYNNVVGTKFNNNDKNINRENYKFFDIQYLYNTFIKNSKMFELYGNNVMVYWKGKPCTVKDIFNDAIYLTINPWYLYELYDVYFKTQIAMIYYEIREVTNRDNFNIIKKTLVEFRVENFPRKLEPIVNDIKILLEIPDTHISVCSNKCESTSKNELSEQKQVIEKYFREFNIVFNGKKEKKGIQCINSVMGCFSSDQNSSIYDKINDELKEKVQECNKLFSALRKIVDLTIKTIKKIP